MRAWALPLALLCSGLFHVHAMEAHHRQRANPIRKVVNMLKMMEKKVKEEGETRQKLFEKYMCYCKKTTEELTKSTATAEDQIPQLESSLKQATAMHQELSEELKMHKSDRSEAEEAVETAKSLREKERHAFNKESSESKANVAALRKAITAIDKGVNGFLQTSAVSVLKKLSLSLDMSTADRDLLSAYLTAGQGGREDQQYAPQSGEIFGILKQMLDEMEKELAEITKEETAAVANHEALIAAKKREIAAATKAIEGKTGRIGDLAVEKATLSDDLENTKEGLAEDTKFLADLSRSCGKTKTDWENYLGVQSEEKVAIADTIKMLNDDDALDLFKKTLPSSSAAMSFLQIPVTNQEVKQQVHRVLRSARNGDPRVDFVQLMLRGEKGGFDKVLQKIDDLRSNLGEEQKEDDSKRDFCNAEIDKTEDELKAQQRSISDTKTVIAETKDSLEQTIRDVAALMAGIKELDKQVAEATDTRKLEHLESVQSLTTNNAALQLLDVAMNRLNKFYNPQLYKAPPKTDALLVEVREHQQSSQEPPPNLGFKKQGEASGGVIQMLNALKAVLQKQITTMEMEEKDAQVDYEAFIEDCAEKRATDSKAIANKESAKAEAEATINKETADLKTQEKAEKSIKQELMDLHEDCDWFLKNFDLRKQARADESDSLAKAKAVLSGADYS